MSGIVNTIVKNHFEVYLNFPPIRVIRFRNSDPNINLIQKDKLIPEVNINHSKIYILHNATLLTIGSVKIPIFWHLSKFNVIIPEIGTGIAGVIGRSSISKLNLPIPESVKYTNLVQVLIL